MNQWKTGHFYEQEAVNFLKENGYEILVCNYHYRHGEIDIVAKDGEYLVFAEVKYRKDDTVQHPLAAVDKRKQQKICRTAVGYLNQHGLGIDSPCRFDVVTYLNGTPFLYKNAFEMNRTSYGWY